MLEHRHRVPATEEPLRSTHTTLVRTADGLNTTPELTQSCPIGRGEARAVWKGQAITVIAQLRRETLVKKVLLLAAMSVLAAALLIPTALAGNASVNKVNGDVTFTNMGLTQHWVFMAQDLGNGAVKGNVLDEYNGGTTTAKVISAEVIDAQTASSPRRSSPTRTTRTLRLGTSSIHGPRHGRGLERNRRLDALRGLYARWHFHRRRRR